MRTAITIPAMSTNDRAEAHRVVVQLQEPSLDDVTDHPRLGAAQKLCVDVVTHCRDERQDRPGEHAWQGERKRHAAKGVPAVGVEVTGGLQQANVDLLKRHVEGQDHERKEVVRQSGDDRDRAVEDREVLGQDADHVLEEGEDRSFVAEQDLPTDGPDQEAREERSDDEEQQQVLVPTATEGDRIGDREADKEVQGRADRPVRQRVAPLDRKLRECIGVRLERAGDGKAIVERAAGNRHQEHLHRRPDEEIDQPQQSRRQQEIRRRRDESAPPGRRRPGRGCD